MSTQNGKLWCRQSDIISAYATRSEGKLALTNLPDCLDQRIIGVGCDFVFIMTFVIDVSGYISILKELDYCRKNLEPTLRKEPVGMLDDGLYDGHHVHRGSCSHLSQTPACINVYEQKLDAFEHNDGQSEISSNNSYPIEIHSTIQDWGLGSCHQIITILLLLYTNSFSYSTSDKDTVYRPRCSQPILTPQSWPRAGWVPGRWQCCWESFCSPRCPEPVWLKTSPDTCMKTWEDFMSIDVTHTTEGTASLVYMTVLWTG